MNSIKIKLKRLWSRVYLINYFKYNKLISAATSSSSNENEMLKAYHSSSITTRAFLGELFMFVCHFCEIFLLILILLYAFYHSIWLLVFIVVGFLGLFYNLQDFFVYHPQEPPESKLIVPQPSLYNLPYESIDLITSDSVRVHSYLIKQYGNAASTAPTMVYFHGNAGNIGQRLAIAHYLYNYCACNVMLVEYRGYGLSAGEASEKGFYKDAEASINYLLSRKDINTSRIIPFGQSIGGAVVIDLAMKFNDKLYAFIVENTFTTLPEIGRELFNGIPGVTFLPDIFFKNQFRSIDKVKFLTLPGLFISGQADTMIPPKMVTTLFEKTNSQLKRLLQIDQGTHNDTWLCPGYFQFISKFLQELIISANSSQTQTKPANAQVWTVHSRSP